MRSERVGERALSEIAAILLPRGTHRQLDSAWRGGSSGRRVCGLRARVYALVSRGARPEEIAARLLSSARGLWSCRPTLTQTFAWLGRSTAGTSSSLNARRGPTAAISPIPRRRRVSSNPPRRVWRYRPLRVGRRRSPCRPKLFQEANPLKVWSFPLIRKERVDRHDNSTGVLALYRHMCLSCPGSGSMAAGSRSRAALDRGSLPATPRAERLALD